ncbi:hypothetical protein FC831_13780 [Clostridium botulinum]|nr:hypothetical protein [Clostridium botulinum]
MGDLEHIKCENMILHKGNILSINGVFKSGCLIHIPKINLNNAEVIIEYEKPKSIEEDLIQCIPIARQYYLKLPILFDNNGIALALSDPPKKKMTKAQIEEKLGYEIEIVE